MSDEMTYPLFESRYQNKQYIGSGGFAKVFKVFDHAKNHYVALKIADVRPEWKKFTLKNEVELVNKLPHHRNIARYDTCYRFNTGFTGVMDFAILKFYEYGNLEQFLTKEQLSIEDKRLIIHGILEGVAFLHRNNVMHRDLKAQNILLHREDGVWIPKITDFGLGRQTTGNATITNSAIGLTYVYAAPEQIKNKKIYKNVDLWAAGVVIYRIIADELPFKGRRGGAEISTQSQLELSRKIVNLELPQKLHSLIEPYQTMIKRCLILDPAERAQSAEELIQILDGGQTESDLTVPMPPKIDDLLKERDEQTESLPKATVKPVELSEAEKPPVAGPPEEGYLAPRVNPTIFLPPKELKEEVKEQSQPPVELWPTTNNRKMKWGWQWGLLLILLSVPAAFVWFWYQGQNTIEPDIPILTQEEPVNTPEKKVIERYAAFDKRIGQAKRSRRKLEGFKKRIQLMIGMQSNAQNYRPYYLQAKNEAYLGNNREVLIALREAATIAVKNNTAKNMLLDIEKDEKKAFKRFSKIQGGKHLSLIKKALKKRLEND